MAGYTDARMKEYKRQGMGAETIRGEEAQHRVVNALAGHDNFNDAAGSSYARNLREENEQLGSGQQQPEPIGSQFDTSDKAHMRHGTGVHGNIAADVYGGAGYDDAPTSDEQKFPMMSMRRITKLPYIEDGGEGMLPGGRNDRDVSPGYKGRRKRKDKAAAVYVPPDAGFGVSCSLGNKQNDIENSPKYYNDLREHMREVGPEGVAPIHVQPKGGSNAYGGGTDEHANLGNGGHRVAIAMELGWTHMRTTSAKQSSGYDEESEYGKDNENYDDDSPYGNDE